MVVFGINMAARALKYQIAEKNFGIINSKKYSKDEPVYKLAKKLLKYKNKKMALQDIKDIDVAAHLKMYGQYIKN